MKKINIKKIPSRNKLTSEPITELFNVKYKQSWFKPSGFWYGLKHYWMDFYTKVLRDGISIERAQEFKRIKELTGA